MALLRALTASSGGGVQESAFFGTEANNGTKTWDYDAKIVVASLVAASTNHTIIFDLSGNRSWVMKNSSGTNCNWVLESPSGTTYTATSRSFSMTVPTNFKCNMLIPLDIDFPTSITN